MKKKTVLFSVCLAFIMVLAVCFMAPLGLKANAESANAEETNKNWIPNEKREQFLVGSYVSLYNYSVKSYEDQIIDMAQRGINFQIYPEFTNNGLPWRDVLPQPEDADFEERWAEYERILGENGIIYGVEFDSGSESDTKVNFDDYETAIETAQGKEWAQFYHLRDEPGYGQLDYYGRMLKAYLEKDNTRSPFLNLYPSFCLTGIDYEDYVSAWVKAAGAENLEYLSHDHYPFGTQSDSATYFSDMEVMRKVAYENGKIKTHGFPQAGSWNGTRRPTAAQLRWNIYTCLAYGFKALTYFNWVAPRYVAPSEGGEGYQPAIYSADGEPTELLEPATKLNFEMRTLGPTLMQLDASHAYHTLATVNGVEILPKNFIMRPTSSSANFIISYMENKDPQKSDYLFLVNKDYDNKVTSTFSVSKNCGIEGLELISASTGESETVEIRDGLVTLTFEPGDGKLIRMIGDVVIPEELEAPAASLKSGSYVGPQTVTLSAAAGSEIYYTLDGSFPTAQSTRYDKPITVGEPDTFGQYALRAVAVRGDEISPVITENYTVVFNRMNIAAGKRAWIDGEAEHYRGFDIPNLGWLTDGDYARTKTIATKRDTFGAAYVDLSSSYDIDEVKVRLYDNTAINKLTVQVALQENFSDAQTVFDSASGNWTAEGEMLSVTFESKNARYVRVYCERGDYTSVYTEIEVYNVYNFEDNLSQSYVASDWASEDYGEWSCENGVFKQTLPYDSSQHEWLGSYTYIKKTFANTVIRADVRMINTLSDSDGMIGFSLRKSYAEDIGLIAGVRRDGSGIVWKNYREYVIKTNVLSDFNANTEFNMQVTYAADMVTIAVNGITVLAARNDAFAGNAGYIALFSGNCAAEFENVEIQSFDVDACVAEHNLTDFERPSTFVVERFTEPAQIENKLAQTLDFYDEDGKAYNLGVKWDFGEYDRKTPGYYSIYGVPQNLPASVVNVYGLRAEVRVFVKYSLDKSELISLIEQANTLKESDFTADSWAEVAETLNMAQGLLTDDYMRQSDLGVGIMRLYNAVHALVRVTPLNTEVLRETLIEAYEIDGKAYTAQSLENLEKAIAAAETVVDGPFATQAKIDAAVAALNRALDSLESFADTTVLAQKLALLEAKDLSALPESDRKEIQSVISTARLITDCGTTSQSVVNSVIKLIEEYI